MDTKTKFTEFIEKNELPFKDLSTFNEIELSSENFIIDGDHLSGKGANLFTDYLIGDSFFEVFDETENLE